MDRRAFRPILIAGLAGLWVSADRNYARVDRRWLTTPYVLLTCVAETVILEVLGTR
jgi:hypothetical protein